MTHVVPFGNTWLSESKHTPFVHVSRNARKQINRRGGRLTDLDVVLQLSEQHRSHGEQSQRLPQYLFQVNELGGVFDGDRLVAVAQHLVNLVVDFVLEPVPRCWTRVIDADSFRDFPHDLSLSPARQNTRDRNGHFGRSAHIITLGIRHNGPFNISTNN